MTSSMVKRMSPVARLATGVGGAAAVAVLAAACASGSSTSSSPGAATGAPAGASSSAGGSGSMVIATATSSGGTILTDGSGRAVYLWVKDDGSGTSACTGACTGSWPPVMASGTVTASGGAKSMDLGTITRSDGTKQVTYNGHPLYYYVGDSGSGTASGQGSTQFGAKWWLVSPSGSDVTASVSSFTKSSGGSAPATTAPGSTHSAGGGWG